MTGDARSSALVIGAGIAGMQAALDIANSGYRAVLVESEPSIGGHMAQLSETFPTLDCSQCILTPRTVEVGKHENIDLRTYSRIEGIQRSPDGQAFRVRLVRKAAYIDWSKCTGCGVCQEKCPFKVPSEFECGVGVRKVVYTLSPQAVPNKPVIDAANCRYLISKHEIETGIVPAVTKSGKPAEPKCGACAKFCPTEAIVWDQQECEEEVEVGAVVLATGYDLMPQARLGEYGAGLLPDVVDGLGFERLLAASGPTAGRVLRPSDGKEPRRVVFIQCCGSRDPARGQPHCSKICCMYTAKQAILYKHRVHGGEATVFYIDVRAAGKGYEEFFQRAQVNEQVRYIRGKVSRVYPDDEHLVVKGADTLSHRPVEVAADMVVLAMAVQPRPETRRLAEMLGLATDASGFVCGLDEELAPIETSQPGVFVAGTAQGPKDIPETVAQGSAAAAKVIQLLRIQSMVTA
ncbi:MAG: CoB--CoM heterodisulfide reductase iron-sulfur subunit A family protein [Anaerolineales bacterium]|nr:CoB--CoM heterodisulfide reductase iron-sulfur subunit A family protein [Anaerolineales bacterium]